MSLHSGKSCSQTAILHLLYFTLSLYCDLYRLNNIILYVTYECPLEEYVSHVVKFVGACGD